MNKLNTLFQIAQQNGIEVEYVNFSSDIQGLYYKEPGLPPMIGINKDIVSDTRLLTCILAEELGHHFTTVGDSSAEYYNYAGRLKVDKKEMLAIKWATETLLPAYEIVDAVKTYITTFEELADKLEVTGEFLMKRFEFIAKYSKSLRIDENRQLMLNKLPNIYVYEGLSL